MLNEKRDGHTVNKQQYVKSWYFMITSWFWVGRIPIAPGTFGSIAAYPVYYLMVYSSASASETVTSLYFSIVLLAVLGYVAIKKFHNVTNLLDHKSIVIDEVIGQLLTIALSYKWLCVIVRNVLKVRTESRIVNYIFVISLILFRFFDIKKPFFIWFMDRSLKKYAAGVILDDIVAAIFSAGVVWSAYLAIR
ncbi:Phosphatidylglycerophosphatase A [Alphaproteobacteria bacterium]